MQFFQKVPYFFLILNLFLFFVICQNTPLPRYEQTSAIVGTKFYIFGGWLQTNIASNEVWYLDLSILFSTTSPQWRSDASMPVGFNFGSACVSPFDNATVYFVGGRLFTPNTANFLYNSVVYVFNAKTSQWTTLNSSNIIGFNSSFTSRNELDNVIDNYGKIFSFSGKNYNTSVTFNDMNILDITTMTWSTPFISQNVPIARLDYTATLLPSGLIIYIGGAGTPSISMSEIQTFNTKSLVWTIKIASGSIPDSRIGHSAVLTPNGTIIVYGGSLDSSAGARVLPDLTLLDTTNWVWSSPNISSTNAPPPLTFHSAELYNNFMIVAFGRITTVAATTTISHNVYILDIKSYVWVTNMSTTTTETSPVSSPNNNNNNGLYIGIGIGIGAIVLIGILTFAGCLLFKRQKKQPSFIPTAGSLADEH